VAAASCIGLRSRSSPWQTGTPHIRCLAHHRRTHRQRWRYGPRTHRHQRSGFCSRPHSSQPLRAQRVAVWGERGQRWWRSAAISAVTAVPPNGTGGVLAARSAVVADPIGKGRHIVNLGAGIFAAACTRFASVSTVRAVGSQLAGYKLTARPAVVALTVVGVRAILHAAGSCWWPWRSVRREEGGR